MSLESLFCRDVFYILLLLLIHFYLNEKEMLEAFHIYSKIQSDVFFMVIYKVVNPIKVGQGYPTLEKNYNNLKLFNKFNDLWQIKEHNTKAN